MKTKLAAREWARQRYHDHDQIEEWLSTPTLPHGDSLWSSQRPSMGTWPLWEGHRQYIENLARAWDGYVLVWGDPEPEDCTSANNKLRPYFKGDRRVWLEVIDVKKARMSLESNDTIILPLVADPHNLDPDYLALVDDYHKRYAEQYWA